MCGNGVQTDLEDIAMLLRLIQQVLNMGYIEFVVVVVGIIAVAAVARRSVALTPPMTITIRWAFVLFFQTNNLFLKCVLSSIYEVHEENRIKRIKAIQ